MPSTRWGRTGTALGSLPAPREGGAIRAGGWPDGETLTLLSEVERWPSTPVTQLTVEEARRLQVRERIFEASPAPVAAVVDVVLALHSRSIALRLYRPFHPGSAGIVLFLHGGGWSLGSLELSDSLCRALAAASGCVVASVGYGLAPEHPFPGGLDDAYEALAWLAENGRRYGGDPERLAVVGESAGGNLAAALALLTRERGGPELCHQTLIYPPLDPSCESQSYGAYGAGYWLTADEMRWYWGLYLSGDAGHGDWLAAPLLAPDLRGLPPALVVAAELDPLRSEVESYAARLAAADVPVALSTHPGQIHGFVACGGWISRAAIAVDEVGASIRAAMGLDDQAETPGPEGMGTT